MVVVPSVRCGRGPVARFHRGRPGPRRKLIAPRRSFSGELSGGPMSPVRRNGLPWVKTETRTSATPPLICDLGALAAPDLAVVDALARLRRAAARHGVRLVLRNANGPLRELLAFSGLAAVLLVEPDDEPDDEQDGEEVGEESRLLPGLQPRRQAEQREEHLGVEEVGDPGDPAR
ncbi:STAS domain-containing protein [Kitasatospora purpeofusca]